MTLAIRTMQLDDIPFMLEQVRREGWGIVANRFEMHLEHEPDGCFIAELDGAPVGHVTSTCYADTAFLGNLIVVPEHQRRGVGAALMHRVIEAVQARGVDTIYLEADPPGIRLYERLGFVHVFESLRFERRPTSEGGDHGAQSAHGGVAELTLDAVDACARFDRPIFGDDRARLLRDLLPGAPGAWVVSTDDAVRGFAITQQMEDGIRIGPWVADDSATAGALLQAIINAFPEQRLTTGVSERNENCAQLLSAAGFQRTPSSFRMRLGPERYDGDPARLYAIAGGDRG